MAILGASLVVVGTSGAGATTASGTSGPYSCRDRVCSGLVGIGQHRKLYLRCQGTGTPTVVFIAGRSDRGKVWDTKEHPGAPAVLPSVAKFTRACAYDRPGTFTIKGQRVQPTSSTPVSQPTTAAEGVADLHALLAAAKVPGPYLVVAHSYGGLLGRLYASTYPQEVRGLVMVDALTELMYPALGSQKNQLLWLRLNNNYSPQLDRYHQERTDLLASFLQVAMAPAVPPMPAMVLSADQPYDFKALKKEGILPKDTPEAFGETVWHAVVVGQDKLAGLLHAAHIKDTSSGHYVHLSQPQLVINAIRHVYDQVHHLPDPEGLTLAPALHQS